LGSTIKGVSPIASTSPSRMPPALVGEGFGTVR
jgi:hypothetical protein